MKFSIEKGLFLKALSHGQTVVEKKTTLAVLSHVLLTASKQELSIAATDMDLSLVETIPANVERVGGVCVSAQLIYDVVKKLNDKHLVNIEANQESGQLIISSGRSIFHLPYLSDDDFPQINQSELSHKFALPSPLLKHMIDSTKFAMSSEEKRYSLHGVCFHNAEHEGLKVLRAVATDMHRLSCVEYECPLGAEDMPSIIISRKTVMEILKLIEDADKPIQIGLCENRIEFTVDNGSMRAILGARLVEGEYPDYTEALLMDNEKKLTAPTKAFAQAVDRVGTIISDKVRAIKVNLCNNVATFSAISAELGKAVEELDVDYPYDESVDICFNVRYLMDIANQIPTEEMEISLVNTESSVLIRPTNNQHMVFVLMPMMV